MIKISAIALPFLITAFFLTSLWSCRPQNEIIVEGTAADIVFSTDSIKFDTVINEMQTFTKRLRIINKQKNAIVLKKISLRNSLQNSPFSLIINGKKENSLRDVKLQGGDSLLVLINAKISQNGDTLPLLVEDMIDVETGKGQKTAILQAWGQDAHFLRDSVLTCDAVWSGTKPFVILGEGVLIKENCRLTVEKGVRILFEKNAYFFVFGSLSAKGTAEKNIIFSGIRTDVPFDNALGQWGGVLFAEVSRDNDLQFCKIRNSSVGIQSNAFFDAGNPFPVRLRACSIENISTVGILAINSGIFAENTLIHNCLKQTFSALGGGNYQLQHCTLANFSYNFFREEPQIVLANEFEMPPTKDNPDGLKIRNHLQFSFQNGIVWGNLDEEIFSKKLPDFELALAFSNSILRSKTVFEGKNLFNQNPKFKNPVIARYELDTLSPAKDFCSEILLKTDILNNLRDEKPDAGAYERK